MRLINRTVAHRERVLLGAAPFVVLGLVYVLASYLRRLDNPQDKLLPSLQSMGNAIWNVAFVPDRRTGDLILWTDTFDSLMRLGAGVGVSTLIAITLGIAIGFIPHVRAMFAPFVASISLIPPITILPILFITFGLGEASKVALIVVGTAPVMVRSIAQATIDIPREVIVKAETLGASVWQMIQRVVIPQVLPRLITAIRLGLVPAWIFLISAEAIASTSGLGYRIFLVRRYLAMDIILPYVVWITILAFTIDRLLLFASKRLFRWNHLKGDSL